MSARDSHISARAGSRSWRVVSSPRGGRATLAPTLRYQAFYCEENVYHLAREPLLGARAREVVFISNPAGACAMWHQRAVARPGWPILWDYHVILLVQDPWEVWDLDTRLGLPVPAPLYLHKSFRSDLPEEYLPRFRVVDAEVFAESFSSDRSHMRVGENRWRKPPPPWPLIGEGREPNLMRFVDMEAPFLGRVLDLPAMIAKVSDA